MSSTISILQNNIRKYRKQARITQLKLSILISVSKDYITSIERGRCVPSIKKLIEISEALNINICNFFIE
ncbi:MAG: helix-turn-helix transcriptional regulator [Candidatus Gastranaerophilales bacterium]